MVNILVPTDFSALSTVAVHYAIKIVNRLGGNITLLHVVDIAQTVRATVTRQTESLEDDLIQSAKKDLQVLLKDVSRHTKMIQPIRYEVRKGSSFQDTIRKEARRLRTGLIVMGTKGATGLKKVVIGSNTNAIIEISQVPVLAVPWKATFKGFRNVIYATDLKNLEKELKMLVPYVEKFGSVIHLLHILPNGRDVEITEKKIEKVLEKLKYKDIVSLVLVDRSIDAAIDQYIDIAKADLLAMFTHELSFYEKLFDRSYTRRMAFHSSIPLLAFKTKRN